MSFEGLKMKSIALLSILSFGANAAFSNVSHLGNAVLAFGSANSNDGSSAFFPSSDGSTIGMYETFDGGENLQYEDGVGAASGALLLMAAGSRDVDGQNMSVVAGGLFGSAISQDGGHTWGKLNVTAMYTQDVKYETASGMYELTGVSLGQPKVAVSNDGGNSFNMITVTGLYNEDVRYGSVPSKNTIYVTAGMWPSDDTVVTPEGTKRITALLSVNKEGQLTHEPISDDNVTNGYWAQVAKTTDGGATWSIVFEDFESELYPNDIHCYDENTCTFALEGGVEPRIMTTTDGGKSWNSFTDQSGGVSLVAVRMTGPTEAFVAGGGDVGRMWHTTDLINWEASTTAISDAASLFSFALTADGSTSFATGILRSQLCSMLKLEF